MVVVARRYKLIQVLLDIERVQEEGAPKKRIKPHLPERALRNAALKHSSKLDQVLAIACYRAEEIRAGAEHRDMNMEVALAAFEQNPFRWAARGRQSQVEVAFFWSWCGSDGAKSKCFSFAMLHHVLARQVPRPAALAQSDADLWKSLTGIASVEKASQSTVQIPWR